jgi:hypothetical protein
MVFQGPSQLMQVPWVPYQKDGTRQPLKKAKCTSSIIRLGPRHGLILGYVSIVTPDALTVLPVVEVESFGAEDTVTVLLN